MAIWNDLSRDRKVCILARMACAIDDTLNECLLPETSFIVVIFDKDTPEQGSHISDVHGEVIADAMRSCIEELGGDDSEAWKRA
jgi:hypothetical protein